MLTILIWLGSGFAFAVGILVGAWLCRMSAPAQESSKQAAVDSLAALRERNSLSREQCNYLLRIAECMEERP